MFQRIEQPRILREILEQIKQNIANGQLKKGDRLPSERQMAEMFGVSRAIIREAIKSLEMIGLIDCVQGGGNYIATNINNGLTEPLSIMFMLEGGTITQVQQLRRSLEITAVGLAAARISQADLAVLDQICTCLEGSDHTCDEVAQDRAFHFTLAHASGNPLFITMQNAVSALIENQIRGVRSSMLREPDTMTRVNAQHRAVLEALRAGDPARAVAAMTNHLDFIEKYLIP